MHLKRSFFQSGMVQFQWSYKRYKLPSRSFRQTKGYGIILTHFSSLTMLELVDIIKDILNSIVCYLAVLSLEIKAKIYLF